MKDAYKHVERRANQYLLDMLPQELRDAYVPYMLGEDEQVEHIVKAADKLAAYIKCVEEQKAGNLEFESAARQTLESMHAMERPELNWFIAECLPAFALNLDELGIM
jgi:5'-deoxynucleotidase